MRDWEWGAAWSIASAKLLIEGSRQIADSDYETKFNRYLNAFRDAKDGWLSKQDLLRQIRVSAKERDDIIKNMAEEGLIELEFRKTKGRMAVGWKWLGEE